MAAWWKKHNCQVRETSTQPLTLKHGISELAHVDVAQLDRVLFSSPAGNVAAPGEQASMGLSGFGGFAGFRVLAPPPPAKKLRRTLCRYWPSCASNV